MAQTVECVFPHSNAEFPTPDALRRYLSNTLAKSKRGRYKFGKIGYRDKDFKTKVIPGSLVLFRKKGLIVGEATSQTMINQLKPPEQGETETGKRVTYYHDIFLLPQTVKVYAPPLPVQQIERWAHRELYPHFYSVPGTRREYEAAFRGPK